MLNSNILANNKAAPNTSIVGEPENTYYNNFSKYVLISTTQNNVTEMNPPFTYLDYCQNNSIIENYKLPELRAVAKYYDLYISGNKPIVKERIITFFQQTRSALHIQRIFRGHIVRYSMQLRGSALYNRQICVNETDFYTLDPIANISPLSFFSYTDENQYVYGFHIHSAISLVSKTTKLINPYNRTDFPKHAITSLVRLYCILHIIYPTALNMGETCVYTQYDIHKHMMLLTSQPAETRNTTRRTSPTRRNPVENEPPNPPATQPVLSREEMHAELLRKLSTIRENTTETRIRELFIEINLLGNYAESRWFHGLARNHFARFYQAFYDWWHVHSNLDAAVRSNICILDDPFSDVGLLYIYPTTTVEQMAEACLRLMENMVYGGIDVEYRKIGVLHSLRILTIVSLPARNAMPWLYESLFS
jgi:hypothetical protein